MVSPQTDMFTVSSGLRDNDISGRDLCSNCNEHSLICLNYIPVTLSSRSYFLVNATLDNNDNSLKTFFLFNHVSSGFNHAPLTARSVDITNLQWVEMNTKAHVCSVF